MMIAVHLANLDEPVSITTGYVALVVQKPSTLQWTVFGIS